MWPFRNRQLKKVNTLGYANGGVVLALQITSTGTLLVIIDTIGHNGVVPLQKPAQVSIEVKQEHIAALGQWISNIKGNATYVNHELLSV